MQIRSWLAASAVMGVLFSLAITDGSAQDAKPAHEKHDQSALFSSLREVIVVGIDLYNTQGDHAGCYRVFQGSLLSVKPFLSADLKKKIDDSLKNAERMPLMSDRAFELRKALDEVRAAVNPATTAEPKKTDGKVEEKKAEEKKTDTKKFEEKKTPPMIETKIEKKAEEKKAPPKVEEKKVEPKKVEEKKVEPKKVDPAVETKKAEEKKAEAKKVDEKKAEPKVEAKKEEKKAETKSPETKGSDVKQAVGNVAGTITFQGQPLPTGNFLTFVSKEGKKFSTLVQKAGNFTFSTTVPPGEYRIVVEPAPGATPAGVAIPEQFRNENTSGLSVNIQAGRQNLQLQLVR